jgi:D-hydroxyproline dehydrogenase subunit gamma
MSFSRFKTLTPAPADATVAFTFDGRSMAAPGGRSVAAALLESGVQAFRRTTVSGAPRAPYCMMGVCFECLVQIDGVPNRQACLTEVRAGMQVCTQQGRRRLATPEPGDA